MTLKVLLPWQHLACSEELVSAAQSHCNTAVTAAVITSALSSDATDAVMMVYTLVLLSLCAVDAFYLKIQVCGNSTAERCIAAVN
jgi:urease accessory protein UreF